MGQEHRPLMMHDAEKERVQSPCLPFRVWGFGFTFRKTGVSEEINITMGTGFIWVSYGSKLWALGVRAKPHASTPDSIVPFLVLQCARLMAALISICPYHLPRSPENIREILWRDSMEYFALGVGLRFKPWPTRLT